ncbi:hypothetical protein PZ938_07355 [Luteipulveratus sp. YIM 133132]|uniref:HAAS signaling domain-containing protein n=1 Tax=Luteipulveratus flavus TaxID=3031728 RepID=UPI0023B0950C|nr:hypothetical protein [Luteipulveratus sp. YIM 133132]MDE9365418.1 hypothetical protein [Luteipulveratus sp. YIM 133132]
MKTYDDPQVSEYLARLRTTMGALPADEREDLWMSVTAHIDEGIARGESVDAVLARLGSPEEITAAAAGEPVDGPRPVVVPAARPEPRLRWREVAALILLQIGIVAWVVGWVAGVVLLWTSNRWRWWEKVLGTLVWPGGIAGVGFAYGTVSFVSQECSTAPDAAQTCSGSGTGLLDVLGGVVLLAVPIVVTIYLAKVARPGRGEAGS